MFLLVAATKGLGERKASEGKDHDEHCKLFFPLTAVKDMFQICL